MVKPTKWWTTMFDGHDGNVPDIIEFLFVLFFIVIPMIAVTIPRRGQCNQDDPDQRYL